MISFPQTCYHLFSSSHVRNHLTCEYKRRIKMHNFQNDLQNLEMDTYQVGELTPIFL